MQHLSNKIPNLPDPKWKSNFPLNLQKKKEIRRGGNFVHSSVGVCHQIKQAEQFVSCSYSELLLRVPSLSQERNAKKKQYTEIFFYDLSGQTAAGFPQPVFLSSWELWGHVPKGTVP